MSGFSFWGKFKVRFREKLFCFSEILFPNYLRLLYPGLATYPDQWDAFFLVGRARDVLKEPAHAEVQMCGHKYNCRLKYKYKCKHKHKYKSKYRYEKNPGSWDVLVKPPHVETPILFMHPAPPLTAMHQTVSVLVLYLYFLCICIFSIYLYFIFCICFCPCASIKHATPTMLQTVFVFATNCICICIYVEQRSPFLVSGTQIPIFWYPKLGTFGKMDRFSSIYLFVSIWSLSSQSSSFLSLSVLP